MPKKVTENSMSEEKDVVMARRRVSRRGSFVFFIVLIGAIGCAGYFYYENKQLRNNPSQVAEQEAEKIVAEIAKLIDLPEGEAPTVATVVNPEDLQDQPFFAKAKAGDRVLIYQAAGRAILYSPRDKKILEVAVFQPNQPSRQVTPTVTPETSADVGEGDSL